jgi:hypothetical protein
VALTGTAAVSPIHRRMPALSTEPPRAWHEVSIEVGRGDMDCRRSQKAALRDLEELAGPRGVRRRTEPAGCWT